MQANYYLVVNDIRYIYLGAFVETLSQLRVNVLLTAQITDTISNIYSTCSLRYICVVSYYLRSRIFVVD
jgi:hypothetical protein